MHAFFNRFYFFSKLITSLILLLILLILIYLFVKAYLDPNNIEKSNLKINDLSNKIDMFSNNIAKNSENINLIKDLLAENKKLNAELINELNIIKEKEINTEIITTIENLSEENKQLRDKLSKINSDLFIEQKNKNFQNNFPITNLLNFIELKLDNGQDYSNELSLLKKALHSNQDSSQDANIEKLESLSFREFIGVDLIFKDFEKISSKYLNDYYIRNNNFLKYFANFILFQPNLKEQIKDKNIRILSEIQNSLTNKDYGLSLKLVYSLDRYEEYFVEWIEEVNKYYQIKSLIKDINNIND
ncbi:MAG: hypothetical protein CFH19_00100 [Alphaproteobacteria bacterium MarineAlpha5_Bin9]|nr:MAG: hypothetical protein CFH19_00100 [Alphaproteobacteria bacterium MarineAlpha5_Bin9]|tara:strand:+ start:23855 stop:24760 length:906 start_codon:yes stop_codon:yes gene_type:complete